MTLPAYTCVNSLYYYIWTHNPRFYSLPIHACNLHTHYGSHALTRKSSGNSVRVLCVQAELDASAKLLARAESAAGESERWIHPYGGLLPIAEYQPAPTNWFLQQLGISKGGRLEASFRVMAGA